MAVGYTYVGDIFGPSDFAVARYQPDGSLDASFGQGGKVTTAIAGGLDAARAVAVSPAANRIVVAGRSSSSTNSPVSFSVAVYQENSAFDFGTATSPVAPGWTQVTEATGYSAPRGYGWLPGSSVMSYDRGVGTDLTRDFNYTTTQATFAVDLPNSTYYLTVLLGDTAYAHQGMGIFLQGTQVDNVSTQAGQFLCRSYPVTVTNGPLDLGLQALGGTNTAAVIESLDIM